MIFDTHCHYNMDPFVADWQSVWDISQAKGVMKSMVVGADIATSRKAVEIANQDPNLYASVGLHPGDVDEQVTDNLADAIAELDDLIKLNPKVTAVGEIGLDYFRLESGATQTKETQKSVFKAQIQLANVHHLPILIHSRDKTDQAYRDLLEILKINYSFERPFVLHCASGPLDYIEEAVSLGAYIGVAGNVTYKNADPIRSIVRLAPLDKVLLETDAPFLPPQAHRGQTCEPWMITETAQYLSEELGIKTDQLFANAMKFFNLE